MPPANGGPALVNVTSGKDSTMQHSGSDADVLERALMVEEEN
jgi:hypothetical protein